MIQKKNYPHQVEVSIWLWDSHSYFYFSPNPFFEYWTMICIGRVNLTFIIWERLKLKCITVCHQIWEELHHFSVRTIIWIEIVAIRQILSILRRTEDIRYNNSYFSFAERTSWFFLHPRHYTFFAERVFATVEDCTILCITGMFG